MTSEVVVMNRIGIALAADSVVSIYYNGVHKKRHDSVVKLFMLSEKHPVGIMVYNNASLLGVPWETIIKLFRKSLEDDGLETLEEYGLELINFLMNRDALFPEEVQQKYFRQEFEGECHRIKNECEWLYKLLPLGKRTGEDSAQKERARIVAEVMRDRLASWQAEDDAEGVTEKSATDFLNRMSGEVSQITMKVFADWPVGSVEVDQLSQIARHLIYKINWDSELYTGIVIGGFGETEHFPVVQHIVVNGIYEGELKYERPRVQRISENKPSYIESFAENKAVKDFLEGVSEEVRGEIKRAAQVMREAPVEALRFVTGMRRDKKAELISEVEKISEEQARDLEDKIKLLAGQRYKGILDVVDILPLKELANVASTLVKLSSFEKELSLEVETVGEPIDLAVISKGDGFIWIKRKHYFQADLNHRYFRNVQQPQYPGKEEADGEVQGE